MGYKVHIFHGQNIGVITEDVSAILTSSHSFLLPENIDRIINRIINRTFSKNFFQKIAIIASKNSINARNKKQ